MDSINVSTNEELERRKEELSREEKKQIRAESARRKKVFFVLTLVINFGILGVFKYCNNFISFINNFIPYSPKIEVLYLHMH